REDRADRDAGHPHRGARGGAGRPQVGRRRARERRAAHQRRDRRLIRSAGRGGHPRSGPHPPTPPTFIRRAHPSPRNPMTSLPVLADRESLASLAAAQRDLIRSLQHPDGAYPASPTFSAYRGYSWFRDGAFIADAMSAGGDAASAEAFFGWCARVIEQRRDD